MFLFCENQCDRSGLQILSLVADAISVKEKEVVPSSLVTRHRSHSSSRFFSGGVFGCGIGGGGEGFDAHGGPIG